MTNSYEVQNREWWVQRWLELLDSYRFKKRLERARIYAREGHIRSIEFAESKVLARVQGTEPEPYKVSLSLEPFTEEQWGYVLESLAEKAIFSAQLLAGEMPQTIEAVFAANGLSLFPFTLSEIQSKCSCPDKQNPCKHIGAVYYELGDRFSEDPFVLFQLRGRTKAQILNDLRQLRSGKPEIPVDEISEVKGFETTATPLSVNHFWDYNEPLDSSLVVIAPPLDSRTILDVLGNIPLGASDTQAVMQYLNSVYQTVSQKGVISALNRDD